MSEKRRSSALRSPLYERAAWAIRAVLALALVWELLTLDPVGVHSMAFFIALSFAYLLRGEKLPNAFDALIAAFRHPRPRNAERVASVVPLRAPSCPPAPEDFRGGRTGPRL